MHKTFMHTHIYIYYGTCGKVAGADMGKEKLADAPITDTLQQQNHKHNRTTIPGYSHRQIHNQSQAQSPANTQAIR